MTLEQFCTKLPSLQLTHAELVLVLLWYHDEKTPDCIMTTGELAKIIRETGLGSTNTTSLQKSVLSCGHVILSAKGIRLKVLSRAQIREMLLPILGAIKTEVDQDLGFLPKDVWNDTRGYIEKVCEQLNGCYQFGFYDAGSVMLRRVVETLIIEAYETLERESDIKDASGNYFMLRDLVAKANGSTPLSLGRDAKEALSKIKELGDRAAHTRRYNAVRADLDKVQSGVRVVVDDLMNLAKLRRAPKP
jgi:hypothetical protein